MKKNIVLKKVLKSRINGFFMFIKSGVTKEIFSFHTMVISRRDYLPFLVLIKRGLWYQWTYLSRHEKYLGYFEWIFFSPGYLVVTHRLFPNEMIFKPEKPIEQTCSRDTLYMKMSVLRHNQFRVLTAISVFYQLLRSEISCVWLLS